MSADGTVGTTPRGPPSGEEEAGEAQSFDGVVATEIFYEYLVETWNQNEAIKQYVQSQQEAMETLEAKVKTW